LCKYRELPGIESAISRSVPARPPANAQTASSRCASLDQLGIAKPRTWLDNKAGPSGEAGGSARK
jgi:hypothetical protein